jgi:hypothetical protein
MSYRANKPFGRRKTDLSTSARESSHWQQIRRDVDEDSSGMIRRYLRLSEKIVGAEDEVKPSEEAKNLPKELGRQVRDQEEQKVRAA